MTRSDVASLQAWMQHRITAGSWTADADDADIRAFVVGSPMLSPERRLGIYATSYVMRLAECMRAEFPVLKALVGEQVFNLFVGGYLSAAPPTSYSLYDLGAGFADYLESTRPRPHSGPETPEALPASLARLERAMAEAERAEGVETWSGYGQPFDLLTMLKGREVCCRVPASLRLLRLNFDFTDTLAAAQRGEKPQMPPARETLMAIGRNHYRVRAQVLESWAYAWLAALAANGGAVWAATRTAAERTGRDADAVGAAVLVWLPSAVESGYLGMSFAAAA
jgi:hypothetical protein